MRSEQCHDAMMLHLGQEGVIHFGSQQGLPHVCSLPGICQELDPARAARRCHECTRVQQPNAPSMERVHMHRGRFVTRAFQPVSYLFGRLLGEGDGKDAVCRQAQRRLASWLLAHVNAGSTVAATKELSLLYM